MPRASLAEMHNKKSFMELISCQQLTNEKHVLHMHYDSLTNMLLFKKKKPQNNINIRMRFVCAQWHSHHLAYRYIETSPSFELKEMFGNVLTLNTSGCNIDSSRLLLPDINVFTTTRTGISTIVKPVG